MLALGREWHLDARTCAFPGTRALLVVSPGTRPAPTSRRMSGQRWPPPPGARVRTDQRRGVRGLPRLQDRRRARSAASYDDVPAFSLSVSRRRPDAQLKLAWIAAGDRAPTRRCGASAHRRYLPLGVHARAARGAGTARGARPFQRRAGAPRRKPRRPRRRAGQRRRGTCCAPKAGGPDPLGAALARTRKSGRSRCSRPACWCIPGISSTSRRAAPGRSRCYPSPAVRSGGRDPGSRARCLMNIVAFVLERPRALLDASGAHCAGRGVASPARRALLELIERSARPLGRASCSRSSPAKRAMDRSPCPEPERPARVGTAPQGGRFVGRRLARSARSAASRIVCSKSAARANSLRRLERALGKSARHRYRVQATCSSCAACARGCQR